MNPIPVALRLLVLLLASSLSGCFMFQPIVTLPRDVAILSDHARAEAALKQGDLKAAEGFLTGKSYRHRSREVVGTSWGELSYQAALVVLAADARGESVDPDALFQAHISLSYSYDLPTALDHLDKAQRLLEGGKLSSTEVKRKEIFRQRFPKLVVYRYLEAGGQIDWHGDIQQGLYRLNFHVPKAKAGERDPREFYRFLVYLTAEDREWLFANLPQRAPLDPAIWRDEARLKAFSPTIDYYYWYDDNGLDWYMSNALTEIDGPERVCVARRRGYDVIPNSGWDFNGVVDPQTCLLPRRH